MHKQTKNRIIKITCGLAVLALIVLALRENAKPGQYDDFTKCLKDKGTIFYGAFWCSHCQNQKALFEKSKQYLPYVECSTENGKGQTAICEQKGIKSYPTWVFADGTQESREFDLNELAEKTGCVLPQ